MRSDQFPLPFVRRAHRTRSPLSDVMTVFVYKSPLTPFLRFCLRHNLTTLATPRKRSISLTMPPRISEGNNAAQVNAELETLFKNGWKLDEEQIQLEKIYHFKTYTKVAVSKSSDCHDKTDISGFTSHNCNEKQIRKSSFGNENCKDHSSLYLNDELIIYRNTDPLRCIGQHTLPADSPIKTYAWRNTVTNKQRVLEQ